MRLPAVALAVSLVLGLFAPVERAMAGFDEAEVKAAFIINLLRFAQWPAEVLGEGSTLRLCYLGVSLDQEKALGKLEGKSVVGHPLRMQPVRQAHAGRECHAVVFGPYAPPSSLYDIQEYGLLTIGEEGFIDLGGMVGLVTRDNRIVLEFNLDSLRRGKLRIPPSVLNLGRRIIGK
jgi:hypothetical protein